MAINFNIATPGLLANPQPYVNTGLLAAQGPQAARLRAPVAQMPAQENLGTALDSAADAFTDMRKDQMRAEAHKDQMESRALTRQGTLASIALREAQLGELNKTAQTWTNIKEAYFPTPSGKSIAQGAHLGATLVQEAKAAAAPAPIKEVTQAELRVLEPPPGPQSIQDIAGYTPQSRLDSPEPMEVEVEQGTAPDGGFEEMPVGDPSPRPSLFFSSGPRPASTYSTQSLYPNEFKSVEDVRVTGEVGREILPTQEPPIADAGVDEAATAETNPQMALANLIRGLPEGQSVPLLARIQAAIGTQDREGLRQAIGEATRRIDPQLRAKAAEPVVAKFMASSIPFRAAVTSYRTMVNNLGASDSIANVVFIKSLYGILEPGLAVTDGEAEMLASGKALTEQAKSKLSAWFTGEPLTDVTKSRMMRAAKKAMAAQVTGQQDLRASYIDALKAYRVDLPTVLTERIDGDLKEELDLPFKDHAEQFPNTTPDGMSKGQLDSLNGNAAIHSWYLSLSEDEKTLSLLGSHANRIADAIKESKAAIKRRNQLGAN
jgi:hypothetical protein